MKNKTLCFVSTHAKLCYNNGILNLETLIQWRYVGGGIMLSGVCGVWHDI